MKKFSTAACVLVFAILSAPLLAAAAAPAARVAEPRRCEFLPNAPDQHLVVRGDTLWGISGKFLEHPWCWPQVWGMNREQIRDPHWIYPGQIVYFDRVAGRLRLANPAGGAGAADGTVSGDVRLSPQVRIRGLERDAVLSIPAGIIEPFLSQPLIVEEHELNSALRIVATQEGRVNIAKGDRAYGLGDLDGGTSFQAFRPSKPLKDPGTKEIIGYEAVYLGTLKLVRDGSNNDEAHSFTVVTSKEEMGIGDRLLPVTPTPFLNYMPHPPQDPVDGRIVSVYGGVTQAGQNQVVTVNRGKNDGLDLGAVLELYRFSGVIKDRTNGKNTVKLPDERYGTLFVFRVFERISYGLVMQVSDTVQVGDVVKSPE